MTPDTLTETDLKRIAQMNAADLEKLYRAVKDRIPTERLMAMINENVLSVRMPSGTIEQIRSLALASSKSRSQIVREAVADYASRQQNKGEAG